MYVHTTLLTDSNKHCWTIINLKGFTFKKHIAGNWKIKYIAYFGRTVSISILILKIKIFFLKCRNDGSNFLKKINKKY